MVDRRQDDRVQVGKECNLYIKDIGEITVTVKDISEIGIAFIMPYDETLHEKLKNIRELHFSYLDEFIFLGTEQSSIITASCNVVRVVKEDNSLLLGCTLASDKDIRQYVTRKKVSKFMELVKKQRT